MLAMRKCAYCGQESVSDAAYCSGCGSLVAEQLSAFRSRQASPRWLVNVGVRWFVKLGKQMVPWSVVLWPLVVPWLVLFDILLLVDFGPYYFGHYGLSVQPLLEDSDDVWRRLYQAVTFAAVLSLIIVVGLARRKAEDAKMSRGAT